ncbi:hypothetical protein ACYKDZ_17805 [Stutzerimonas stutzeri]
MNHEEYKRVAKIDRRREKELLAAGSTQGAEEYRLHGDHMGLMAERTKNGMDLPMPSIFDIYEFLRNEYLNSRFEGMNAAWPKGVPDGGTYADLVAKRYLEYLQNEGFASISHFESRRGKHVVFNRALQIINDESPVIEKAYRAGSLSAPMAGNW